MAQLVVGAVTLVLYWAISINLKKHTNGKHRLINWNSPLSKNLFYTKWQENQAEDSFIRTSFSGQLYQDSFSGQLYQDGFISET